MKLREWKIFYAREADAKEWTDCAYVNTRQLNKMKKLPWIKLFGCYEVVQSL